MPPDDRKSRAAHCPRCGYDLRGSVATWAESCPLEGVCNECGLDFDWADVLRADRNGPRWCIEYEKFRRRLPRSAARTLFHSFWPWGFWRDLQMHHDPQWHRMAVYLGMLLVPFVLLYVIEQSTTAIYVRYHMTEAIRAQQAQIPQTLARTQTRLQNLKDGKAGQMSAEEREERIRLLTTRIALLQQELKTPPEIDHSYLAAIAEAVFMPWASTSWGSFNTPMGTSEYPAPRELHEYAATLAGNSSTVGAMPIWRSADTLYYVGTEILWAVAGFLISLLFVPATFLLLPITRRRAKVRWAHIARVTIYSIFIPVFVLLVAGVFLVIALYIPALDDFANQVFILVAGLASWPMLVIWWAVAIKRHLHMPHGAAIAFLMTLMSILLIVIGAGILDGSLL